MKRSHGLLAWVGLLLVVVAATAVRGASDGEPIRIPDSRIQHAVSDTLRAFKHETHAGLFPLCAGCHEGIETGVTDDVYPSIDVCQRCHDGSQVARIDIEIPSAPRASNLAFDHRDHRTLVRESGEVPVCATCHGAGPRSGEMTVHVAEPEACLDCHANETDEHLAADADCAICHVPLPVADRMNDRWVAELPRPADHDVPDFATLHGDAIEADPGRCETCHARESCERCHANAPDVASIQALERDERVARMVCALLPEYPVPDSHHETGWARDHGAVARDGVSDCANCHARETCASCHIGDLGRVALASLPTGDPMPGCPNRRGVPDDAMTDDVHEPDVITNHAVATAAITSCSSCHGPDGCSECHAGAGETRFHPANFLVRHANHAYGAFSDCQSCHDPLLFCRDCHQSLGMETVGRVNDSGFHSSQPLWILSHGHAARQSLDSCATCHGQRDCLECHSNTRGWGVNPHGPDFDPSRITGNSRATCAICHGSDPGNRRRSR